jgi:hypothetical protein
MVGDKTLFVQAKMSFMPLKKKNILLILKKKRAGGNCFLGLHVFFFLKKELSMRT